MANTKEEGMAMILIYFLGGMMLAGSILTIALGGIIYGLYLLFQHISLSWR